jgi:small conductance mechanosensitive channel
MLLFTEEVATEEFSLVELLQTVAGWLMQNGIKLIIGLIILFIAFKVVNFIAKRLQRRLDKKNVDKTIANVTVMASKLVLKIMVFLLFLGYVGIETAGIGTIIGSVSVCIGLAVQGSLSNFAGGIVILVMRPFKLGDFIEAQGHSGTVTDIKMFYTYLNTPDNKVVMIPNGTLGNGDIINYSKEEERRVDLVFSVDYSTDLKLAKEIIEREIKNHQLILKDKGYFVRLGEMAASSLDIKTRVWVKNADYWTVYFDLLENVKKKFDENDISVPFNQLDVHITK